MKQTAICTFCFSILKHCALILSFTRFIWMKKEKQSVKCSKKMYPLLQPILISCRIWEGLCYYIELRARGNFFFFILCTFGWEKNLLIYTDQNFDLLDWPILLKKKARQYTRFPLCFTFICHHGTEIAAARKMIC